MENNRWFTYTFRIMRNKKKVLCFMPGTAGGSQRMMLALTKQLNPTQYDICVAVVENEVTTITDYLPERYKLLHIKVRNIWDFSITKMLLVVKKEKPDFIFSSLFYLNLRALIVGKIAGIPVVLRNDNYLAVTKPYQRTLIKHIYKWAKVVIMQQEEMRDEFKAYFNFPDEKMIVIHNPIDKDSIDARTSVPSPYPDDGSINYLWVGRFDKKKGQDVLVEAFAKMHNRVPKSHLYLVGRPHDDMSIYNRVMTTIQSNHLEDYVHLIGHDTNPYRWTKNCHCFVLPSRLEGLPNALVEAMYLNRPVVATTCIPIISRMVKDGYNGYLVPSEDVDAMADAMVKAIELKDFDMIYRPGSPEMFSDLFK